MKNETNLNPIKEYLNAWLHLPCVLDKRYGGLLNNHPIIDVAAMIDNTLVLVNDENIDVIRNQYMEQIEKNNDVYQLFMVVKKPYRLTLFQEVYENLSEVDYNSILNWVYKDIEFPNHNNDIKMLTRLFEQINPKLFMSEKDMSMYESLPDEIKLYRGMYSDNYYRAVSWTTDIDVAEWFANRFTSGYIVTATVHKTDVFCCYDSEKEVVVNPTRISLTGIRPADQVQDLKNEEDNQGFHNSFSWFSNK